MVQHVGIQVGSKGEHVIFVRKQMGYVKEEKRNPQEENFKREKLNLQEMTKLCARGITK